MCNKKYIYPYQEKPYYKRVRELETIDGTKIKTMTTRFSYGYGIRISKNTGPRGGKRYEQFARMVYYYDGKFYRVAKMALDADFSSFANVAIPIESKHLFDAHPLFTAHHRDTPTHLGIALDSDGEIKSVYSGDFVWYDSTTNDLDWLEDFLNLKPTKRKRVA